MQTRPLSKCMLLVRAYQRARQRKMGIAKKKSCQGFGRLFGKGRLFGRPFFKTNPQELSTLCIYPENSWTTQRMCQTKKTVYHKSCPNMSYPATLEEHPMNSNDIHRVTLALAVSLKRWDVEAGTIKRTSQRNKGMAEKHTKSLV